MPQMERDVNKKKTVDRENSGAGSGTGHSQGTTSKQIPVPVPTCADRGVKCFFKNKKTTNDTGTM
jgi:hypothetical protein